jgi:non-ribosomal peptide synthetase component F
MNNLLGWYRDACEITSRSKVGQVISCSFDASIKNYLTPIACGAALVLFPDIPHSPELLLNFISDHQISVLNPGVPSMFYPLIELAGRDDFRKLSSLRVLVLGSETPDLAPLAPWLSSDRCRSRVLNVYGPTECTSVSCFATIA